jgi:hypothetical protein
MNEIVWHGPPIYSWAQFHETLRMPGRQLLARLDDYEDSVLVAGCQRSGTTAVTRLFKQTTHVSDYGFGPDDELDGALLLAGYVDPLADGRHCFQTTYLNDHFTEYLEHDGFRLIWLLRNPRAVIASMLNNWSRAALNRLFESCGKVDAPGADSSWPVVREWIGVSRLDKACASYISKTAQTFVLREHLGDRMMIVDYDDLLSDKDRCLPEMFEFADIPFDPRLLSYLHRRRRGRRDRLSDAQAQYVEHMCGPVYEDARDLRTIGRELADVC